MEERMMQAVRNGMELLGKLTVGSAVILFVGVCAYAALMVLMLVM